MSDDDDSTVDAGATDPPASAEQAKQELELLVAERDRAEAHRLELTQRIRVSLRRLHDLGVSWAELADLAGYSNAEAARAQAAPRSDEALPPGSVTVREAADHLKVSRQAIYDMVKTGRLEVAHDRPRGLRVYLPERTTPVP